MSEEVSLHLYYSIIGLASLILFSGEITLLYNYTVFRHARYGVIPTPFDYSRPEQTGFFHFFFCFGLFAVSQNIRLSKNFVFPGTIFGDIIRSFT
jgi:hypothetical protein